ncbi:hypothetical protein TNCV_500971 [Trichonephila clavipes]|nr:hypothetical protein TNCV_500971 [Trichonephila clavipes]
MGRTILLERRQSESVGRRNSRTTFLRSDWPRPFARREQGDTLKGRRAASPLVRLAEGEERWEAPDPLQSVLPKNWGGTDQNRTITCTELKANDRRKNVDLSRYEFHGPRSDVTVDQVA